MKNRIIKIVSLILVTSILLSVFSTVCFAEEHSDNTVNQTNANILNELLSEIDMDGAYTFNYEYDSNGRIIRVLCRSGSVETIYNYTYTGNTYECNVTTSEVAELLSEDVELFTSLSGDDLKLSDPQIKSRIEQAKELWNQANNNGDEETKNRAHLEAQIARADACVLHPASLFAQYYLEDGDLSTGTYFRRTLKKGDTGNDVFALQRALMYYDYLDVTKFSTEDYGTYEELTEDAVAAYQEEKMGKSNADGIAGARVLKGLFEYTPSKRNILPTNAGMIDINVYKGKHDLVCAAVMGHLQEKAPNSTIINEAYLYHAGLRGNGGRADVVRVLNSSKMVWEIKPDSKYGVKTGYPQVTSYVLASTHIDNINKYSLYCPLTYGTPIGYIPNIPWKDGSEIVISNYATYSGVSESFDGVVFYRTKKNDKELQPETSSVPVIVPKQQEERKKATVPEPAVVVGGLAATAVATVVTVYVVKGIVAFVGSFFTGGATLILLAC